MTRRIALLLVCVTWIAACRAETPVDPAAEAERAIRELDGRERLATLEGDAELGEWIWADGFLVTNPFGEVLSKPEILEVLRTGVVPYAAFERDVERVQSYGGFAISIGRETVVPAGEPAERRIARRYTHVWAQREGEWRLVARHAAELAEPGER